MLDLSASGKLFRGMLKSRAPVGIAGLGLMVALAPFVFPSVRKTTLYVSIVVVSGVSITALGLYWGLRPTNEVPIPGVPLAAMAVSVIPVVSAYEFGYGIGGALGLVLVTLGSALILLTGSYVVFWAWGKTVDGQSA